MDFCTSHFGKVLSQIALDDLISFFQSEHSETDQLEFKSGGQSIDESLKSITRSISAFLNSKGGLLIWGAPLGIKASGAKVFRGELAPVSESIDRDQLISKISDSITPLPRAIRIHKIGGTSGYHYLFEVDESEYSPHQFGGSYFMRIDGQTRQAPHHYVEALFKKIAQPNLEAYVKFDSIYFQAGHYTVGLSIFVFNWSMQNEEQVSIRLFCPEGMFITSSGAWAEGRTYYKTPLVEILHFGDPCIDEVKLRFNSSELPVNRQIPLILTFGGRHSQMKRSSYTLRLDNVNLSYPEENIVERRENFTVRDEMSEKGQTKEMILAKILSGRLSKS